jgi:acyl-CoA synthetase (AMP-forming)/AMP-acid ligase II
MSSLADRIAVPITLARAGLAGLGSPDRMIAQLAALARWGTTLAGSFISAAARDPDRPAIVDDDGVLTFGEVDAFTSRLAVALGVHEKVGLLCRNHRGMVQALIACGKIGADVVLLNTGMGAGQLRVVLREQEIDLIIADTEFQHLVAGSPIRCLRADALWEIVARVTDPGDPVPPARPGRTIVLSSGTTGRPKGARRPAKPGIGSLAALLSRIPLRVHDTVLIEAPIFHTWGYAALQLAIGLRATIVLRARFDPLDCLQTVEEQDCTVLFAVPVMARRLLDVDHPPLPHLRVVALSGSALPGGFATDFMDEFGDILYNLYGSTEASWVSIATPADLRAAPATAGRPPRGTRVAVLGESGGALPAGSIGRIFVANELPFEGYTSGDAKEVRDGMLCLGDVGHLDAEGRLFVDGRDDDMIVSGGENIFPSEVADVLAAQPEIYEVAVAGVPDDEFGQRLAAWVVLVPEASLDADAVRAMVRERMARFAVPRDVIFLDELPRNATGKVVTRDLPDREGYEGA